MTHSGVPPVERVLRALFWKLLFRGRSHQHSAGRRRRMQISLGWTVVGYLGLGVLPVVTAGPLDLLALSSLLHLFTFLFAALTLASSASTMLFVREEAEILLHRPVRPEQMLRAKVAVLVGFAMILAVSLNAAGLVAGTVRGDGSLWFAPAHLLSTALLMTFAAALVVLVYNVCLRWLGRDRLDGLLATVQALLAIVMFLGTQLVFRLATPEAVRTVDLGSGWLLALPPVWFGALDALLCGMAPERLWLPALLGVAATALLCWLAFARLASSYGTGLQRLGEGGGERERLARRLLPRLIRMPPLRWWLRDPVEQQGFLLATAYLVRDREVKLKVYPSVAPMVLMPLLFLVQPGRRGGAEEVDVVITGMGMGYLAIVPMQVLLLLRQSGQWRAAEWFRIAPLEHWLPLFAGARKAVLCWFALPATLVVTALFVVVQGSTAPLVMGTAVLALLPAMALVPAVGRPWLPLAEPPEDRPQAAAGCLLFAVTGGVAVGAAALGAWLHGRGLGWVFVLGAIAVGFGARAMVASELRIRPWRSAQR